MSARHTAGNPASNRRRAGTIPGPGAPGDVHPVLRRAAAPPAALDLLDAARRSLAEAGEVEARPNERYAAAHLAALRTAAAVLAVRVRPEEQSERRRKRIRPAWDVLPEVAPELAEWSAYFAAGARRRALAEAGVEGAVSARAADDLLRDAKRFLRIVTRLLMLQPALPGEGASSSSDETRSAAIRRAG